MKLPRPSDPKTTEDDNSCDSLRELKEMQTNHWDMDMLPREQLDKLAKLSRQKHRSYSLKRAAIAGAIGLVIALVAVIAVAALRG